MAILEYHSLNTEGTEMENPEYTEGVLDTENNDMKNTEYTEELLDIEGIRSPGCGCDSIQGLIIL
jgi:hypothetical protein